jgi:hypothetical protein
MCGKRGAFGRRSLLSACSGRGSTPGPAAVLVRSAISAHSNDLCPCEASPALIDLDALSIKGSSSTSRRLCQDIWVPTELPKSTRMQHMPHASSGAVSCDR